MKTFIAIFCMAVMSASVNAQSSTTAQPPPPKPSSMEEWKELKEFHMVMAQTFHPMEEGNYKPIRERSQELFEKAHLLAESKVPDEFNKPEVVQAIQELSRDSRYLNAMVLNKAKDEDINKSLTALHDTFHKIVGLCQPGDQHEHHDHSDVNHKN